MLTERRDHVAECSWVETWTVREGILSGNYLSPSFPTVGLQKQCLGKSSPRCNLEQADTCRVESPGVQDTPWCVVRCVLSLGFVKVCGESLSHSLRVVSFCSSLPMVRHMHDSTKMDWVAGSALGKPGWNGHCSSCVSPGASSSAHLRSSVCVSFPLAGRLPSGFYCSFEEGDCGWMPGSSASHPSPWRIGSPEHNRFPLIEGVWE